MRTKPTQYNRKFKVIYNQYIKGENFRLIDEKGKQVGILPRSEAFDYADSHEVDLVLITDNVQPPVVKAINLHKYLYQEGKKIKENHKHQRKSQIKEVTLGLFISDHDFKRLVSKGKQFIAEGNQLRIKLILKGREIIKKQRGFDLVNKYILSLKEISISTPPRLIGKTIISVVTKKK